MGVYTIQSAYIILNENSEVVDWRDTFEEAEEEVARLEEYQDEE